MKALPKQRKPRYALRVIRGGYAPADATAAGALRQKHRVGDLVFAEFTKPRSPGFHRLAHQLGAMLAANLDAFTGKDAHDVLKRLQIEANVGCDSIALNFPGIGPCEYRIPQSLSYESMDEDTFRGVIAGMCRHVSAKYWSSCSAEQIEQMASVWVEAA
jgi:hypothetical protein